MENTHTLGIFQDNKPLSTDLSFCRLGSMISPPYIMWYTIHWKEWTHFSSNKSVLNVELFFSLPITPIFLCELLNAIPATRPMTRIFDLLCDRLLLLLRTPPLPIRLPDLAQISWDGLKVTEFDVWLGNCLPVFWCSNLNRSCSASKLLGHITIRPTGLHFSIPNSLEDIPRRFIEAPRSFLLARLRFACLMSACSPLRFRSVLQNCWKSAVFWSKRQIFK